MYTLLMTSLAVLSMLHKTSLWTLVNSKDIYEKHILKNILWYMKTLLMTSLAVLSMFHKTSFWTLVDTKDIYEKRRFCSVFVSRP